VLGSVTRTATGLGPIDITVRKAAGVVVAGDLSVNSVTLKCDGVDPTTWPKLSCSGPNQAVVNSNIGFGSAPPNHNLTVSAVGLKSCGDPRARLRRRFFQIFAHEQNLPCQIASGTAEGLQ